MNRWRVFFLVAELIVCSILLFHVPFCFAFSNGFYTRRPTVSAPKLNLSPGDEPIYADDKIWRALCDTINEQPDRVLRMTSIDHIDIGLGSVKGTKRPIYFARQELENFLRREQHRDLIVVYFEGAMARDGRYKFYLEELQPFFAAIKYKRVLVVGEEADSYHVYLDREFSSTELDTDNTFVHSCARSITVDSSAEPIDLGINKPKLLVGSGGRTFKTSTPVKFRMEEVEHFLKSEHCKELLEVQLCKGMGKKDVSKSMNNFLLGLGYDRVIFHDGFNLFQVEPTVLRSSFDFRYTSAFIGVLEYEGIDASDSIRSDNPPVARFNFVCSLMGPPPGKASIPIAYELDKSKIATREWKLNDSMMPVKGSRWILFVRNTSPNERGVFETYDGARGRTECTSKNLEDVMDEIESEHLVPFGKFDRKHIHEICD